ncbi:cytochrome P450 [Podospora appendiculata]|uniref:Cytochrome P450 n=1 Tax=Podospora appendiculata TaxID=314037 RepID=A0AAE0XKV3_9PEZI|nr:cytochrome P450 [Podospora appendiculata]
MDINLPYRPLTAVALGAGYVMASRVASSHPILSFIVSFTGLWIAQFAVWALWTVLVYPRFFSPLRGLPQPEGNSLFNGQFAKIAQLPSGAPMTDWINSIPNDGLIRYLGLFNQERLLVTSPAALAEVMVTKNYDFKKPDQIRFSIGRILGVGVLLAEGEEHKMQRKNLLPAFAFRHIKDLYAVFWDKSREVVEAMTEAVLQDAAEPANESGRKDMAVIEVSSWASRVTLDIIGVAGLGHDFGAIEDPTNELNRIYKMLFRPSRQAQVLARLRLIFPGWMLNNLPIKRNDDVHAAARFIRATCAGLIKEKKDKLSRKELTDRDILSLMTFLAAGHETTASSMTWAIYLLAKHTEVQKRLRAEIHQHLLPLVGGDANATVTSLDIDNMPFLNAVCNEVLRYYGPVPLTFRTAARDTSIQGQFVPKGTRIVLCPWAVNKSKSLWGPDALEFNPDRWMAKFEGDKEAASGGAKSNYAYLTFLHGPRSCIGQAFAKAEFACLLAAWVGRFSFEVHNKEELDESKILIKGGITARPANGMYIKATVVEGW